MNMIKKVVALLCPSILVAGATTVTFQGCNNTPNEYFIFTANEGNNNQIGKVSLKNNIPADALQDVTLVVPGAYTRNGKQFQTYIAQETFKDIRDEREVEYDKRLRLKLQLINEGNKFVKSTTNWEKMFYRSGFVEIDLGGLDKNANITNTKMMFYGCNNLKRINLSNFNTSNVTNMESMFHYCCELSELNLSKFNTSKVENMLLMFGECNNLQNLNIAKFDTRNVKTMQSMFNGCHSIKELDLQHFETSNVTTMSWMFDRCKSLEVLNLTNFKTTNVTGMSYMFRGCEKLSFIDIKNFDLQNTEWTEFMIDGCTNLKTFGFPQFSNKIIDGQDLGKKQKNDIIIPYMKNLKGMYELENVTFTK